jgi:hypothetical protein
MLSCALSCVVRYVNAILMTHAVVIEASNCTILHANNARFAVLLFFVYCNVVWFVFSYQPAGL